MFGSKIKMPPFLTCDGLTQFLEDFNVSELHSKLSDFIREVQIMFLLKREDLRSESVLHPLPHKEYFQHFAKVSILALTATS